MQRGRRLRWHGAERNARSAAAASASRLIAREAAVWAFTGAAARPHMDQQRAGGAELRHPRGPEVRPAPNGVLCRRPGRPSDAGEGEEQVLKITFKILPE